MRIKGLVILFTVFHIFIAFPLLATTSSKLTLASKANKKIDVLSQGDSYRFELVIFPIEGFVLEKSFFEDQSFLNFLHVLKVNRAAVSPNNADAYIIDFEAIVTDSYRKRGNVFDHQGLKVPVTLEIPPVGDPIKLDGKLAIVSHKRPQSIPWLLLSMILVLLILVGFTFYKIKNRKRKKSPWLTLKNELSELNEREQLEHLYQNKKMILESLPHYESYFEEINQKQYSPSWKHENAEELIKKKDELVEAINDLS